MKKLIGILLLAIFLIACEKEAKEQVCWKCAVYVEWWPEMFDPDVPVYGTTTIVCDKTGKEILQMEQDSTTLTQTYKCEKY